MSRRVQDRPKVMQLIAWVVLGVIPPAGVFLFSVLPLYRRADELRTMRDALKAENSQNEAFRERQVEYMIHTHELVRQLKVLRKILPDDPETDKVLRTIYGAARGAGARVRSIEPQQLVRRDFYTEAPFTAEVEGSYPALQSFFESLAHQTRIISVAGLSLGPPEGRAASNYRIGPGATIRATCLVTTYFSALPRPSAAPPRSR